jgi:hypothetical protein
MPDQKKHVFDHSKGSTMHVGIEDANVPDATNVMHVTAHVAIMTPMGDPFEPDCIWGAPVFYWGLPSTAKSDKVKQACIECMLPYAPIYPGQRQPEDFAGVLMPGLNGPTIECMLAAVRWLNPQGRGVIFLDEANNATRATEGAMLGFIQDRVVGDTRLAPGIRILAAANPPKWSTSGFHLSPATANRYCHLQVKPPPHRDWIAFMASERATPKFDAAKGEDIVRSRWSSTYAHAKAMLTGYHEYRQGMTLHMEPSTDHPQSGYNWPSHRTWRLAGRLKATADALGHSEAIGQLMIEGCVGEGAAFDMLTWLRNADLPRPEEVLEKGFQPNNHRMDVGYAVLTSVTEYVASIPDRQVAIDMAARAWSIFSNFIQADMGDVIVSGARTLLSKNLGRSVSPAIRIFADPVYRWMADNNITDYVQD